jgi:hypothetical protein
MSLNNPPGQPIILCAAVIRVEELKSFLKCIDGGLVLASGFSGRASFAIYHSGPGRLEPDGGVIEDNLQIERIEADGVNISLADSFDPEDEGVTVWLVRWLLASLSWSS